MVQKYAKHTGSYSCTFYIHIYSRLPRPGSMNEMDIARRHGTILYEYVSAHVTEVP